ncbi:MAG: T9SS type A sorting domain-containing protein [bacterium]|nr:T9SS type A sorting domain-containing protein [bacterium]
MKRWSLGSSRMMWLALALGFVLTTAIPALAAWKYVMQENFENDPRTWTWRQPRQGWTNSQPWVVVPWPQVTQPHWGIQNYIYRVDPSYPERYIQAAWCDASNSNVTTGGRDPEFDRYRVNMHTHMRWGPFATDSLTIMEDTTTIPPTNVRVRVRDARASFEWINRVAVGDTFFWEVAFSATSPSPPNPLTARDQWYQPVRTFPVFDTAGVWVRDTLVRGFHCGRADTYWQFALMKMDSLDSAGTIISALGKRYVWLGWRFKSNAINDSLRGAFVDNVKVSIDDGLFDHNAVRCATYRARDTVWITYPQVGDTLLFHLQHKIAGNGLLRDSLGNAVRTRAQCLVNNQAFFSTQLDVNAGEEETTYNLYSTPFIVPIEGPYEVTWQLDADNTLLESSETNNSCMTAFGAVTPNYPPTTSVDSIWYNGTFRSLSIPDTIYVQRQLGRHTNIPLIVSNGDEDDSASWFLFNSTDSFPGSGSPVMSNRVWPSYEHDGIDTVQWNIGFLADGFWYLSTVIQDLYNEPVYAMSRTVIAIVQVDAPEASDGLLPTETSITNAYPNPFNNAIQLRIGLVKDGNAQLTLHDITGRQVDHIVLDQRAGWQTVTWQPRHIATGVYFARLQVNGNVMSTVKVMYLK